MKKIIIFAVTLLILSALTLPCFAQIDSKYIIDDADLLSDYEEQYLLTSIENLQSDFGYDIVIHTTYSTYGQDIISYCDDYYDNGGYAEDGLIFVINMGERDYYTSTCGTLVDSLPDYQIDDICTNVTPYLSSGEYFSAFSNYLNGLNAYFADGEISYIPPDIHFGNDVYGEYDEYDEYEYEYDYDYDYDYDYNYSAEPSAESYLITEVVVLGGSVAIAFLIVTILKKKMNTAVKQRNADSYVVNDSFNLSNSRDVLVSSNTVRRPIPKNNNHTGSRPGGGGGGGGIRVSSGGVRHGGSGGKF